MSAFTEEQLKELETRYGLTPVRASLKIKDGDVFDGDRCWWRCTNGPEYVEMNLDDSNWCNAKNYPELYSIARPKVKYID